MLKKLAVVAVLGVIIAIPGVSQAGSARSSNMLTRAARGVVSAVSREVTKLKQYGQARLFVMRVTANNPGYQKLYRAVDRSAFKRLGQTRGYPLIGKAHRYAIPRELRRAAATARVAVIQQAGKDGVAVPVPVRSYAERTRAVTSKSLLGIVAQNLR